MPLRIAVNAICHHGVLPLFAVFETLSFISMKRGLLEGCPMVFNLMTVPSALWCFSSRVPRTAIRVHLPLPCMLASRESTSLHQQVCRRIVEACLRSKPTACGSHNARYID